jgi:P27 family predicted phage terminase small subunit
LEPAALRTAPAAPGHLNDAAREQWAALSAELIQMGVLTASDLMLLEITCVHYGIWRELYDTWLERGAMHPSAMEMRQQAHLLLKIAPEFGLSPSSRARASGPLPTNVTALEAHRARRAALVAELRRNEA